MNPEKMAKLEVVRQKWLACFKSFYDASRGHGESGAEIKIQHHDLCEMTLFLTELKGIFETHPLDPPSYEI